MRRRQFSRQNIEVELFPFLSILACTIGTLILLIIVLTTQTFADEQKEVKIIAKGNEGENQLMTPRYIETRADGVIIYPTEEFVPIENFEDPNSAFQKLLQQVSDSRDRQYIIIAIRPDGIEVFQEVRNLIETREINLGYEPLDEGWKLKIQ